MEERLDVAEQKTEAVKKPAKKTAAKKSTNKKVEVSNDPISKSKGSKPSVRPSRTSMAKVMNESKIEINTVSQNSPNSKNKRFVLALIAAVFISSFITYGITHKMDSSAPATTTFLAKISGGVALSESELRSVVFQLKRTVYWTGTQKGAKYTINALNEGQTYIRYLPNGKGVSDTAPNYRTVGTYETKDAYTSTLAAGNEANGVSFTTADGRVIHYNKSSSDNVYVAYKNQNFQIEIFDPKPGFSLKIANNNELQVIK